jgi:hypothetical protein
MIHVGQLARSFNSSNQIWGPKKQKLSMIQIFIQKTSKIN